MPGSSCAGHVSLAGLPHPYAPAVARSYVADCVWQAATGVKASWAVADRETDQGFCYAESGSIPVSGIAPPILLAELELQQSSTTGYHDPLLPPPFADDGSRGRKGGVGSRGKRRKPA